MTSVYFTVVAFGVTLIAAVIGAIGLTREGLRAARD